VPEPAAVDVEGSSSWVGRQALPEDRAPQHQPRLRRGRPGAAAIGLRRSTGCHASAACTINDRARHQKGTTRPGTRPHDVAPDGRATSKNGPPRYGCGTRVRIDTEVLMLARRMSGRRSYEDRIDAVVIDPPL
jgi:hypothetical protein